MAMTSLAFVGFVLGVLLAYNAVSARVRPVLLLAVSLLFYASFSVRHLTVLVAVSLVTYVGGIAVDTRKRGALPAAIVATLLPLAVFKYAGWIVNTAQEAWGAGDSIRPVLALPMGLSFFTFHAVSYLVDIRRGHVNVESNWVRVGLYLAFFPKLLAGPIERASKFLPQLWTLDRSRALNVYAGAKLMLWGFFCKLVVADNVGGIVDAVLKTPMEQSGASLTVASTLYAFQIYFDFLGYTHIAIGVARCVNIHLTPNFLVPYAATSLREFWHRWHITLSSWFRDYVYIPLGGNRTAGLQRVGQLVLVFALSGLWHGAALSFLAWGAFHGVAYAAEDWGRRRLAVVFAERHERPLLAAAVRCAQRLLVFTIVTCGWVVFRAPDLGSVSIVFGRILGVDGATSRFAMHGVFWRSDSLWFLALALIAVTLDASPRFRAALERVPDSGPGLAGELAYVNLFAVSLVLLGDLGVRDFTYFQF